MRGGGDEQPPEGGSQSNANRGPVRKGTHGSTGPKGERPDSPSGRHLEPGYCAACQQDNCRRHFYSPDDHLDEELRAHWAEWIRPVPWVHVAHLTFQPNQRGLPLTFRQLGNWRNGLAKITQGPVDCVAFPEPTLQVIELYHLHALVLGTERLTIKEMVGRWKWHNGHQAKIELYDATLGIEYYVTKMVSADFSEGDFTPGFEKRHELPPVPDDLTRLFRSRRQS